MISKYSITLLAFMGFGLLTLNSQNNPRNLDLGWKTDTSMHTVPLNEFTALMKADGIPQLISKELSGSAVITTNQRVHR